MLGGMPAITGVPETCKSIIKARIFQKKNYTAYNKDTTGVPETCKSNIKARIFQKEKKYTAYNQDTTQVMHKPSLRKLQIVA
jgi:hypothetical protein